MSDPETLDGPRIWRIDHRRRSQESRAGMLVPLAMAVLLLVALAATGIHLMSRQSHEELQRIDGFLRAVAVGDSCQVMVVGRLEAVSWDQRWFKGGADSGSGEWKTGSYDYVIADGPGPHEADLLVRALESRSVAVMFWRLRADPFSLAQYRQVRASYFTHADPLTPVTLPGLETLRKGVDAAIAEREANRAWADDAERAVDRRTAVGDLAAELRSPPGPAIPDEIPPTEPGGQPAPQQPRAGPAARVPPPGIPAFPTPLSLPVSPAPPPGVPPFAQQRVDLAQLQASAKLTVEELNRTLGEPGWEVRVGPNAPYANEPNSAWSSMELKVKLWLRDCGALGVPPVRACDSADIQAYKNCEAAVDLMHSDLRPGCRDTMNELFVNMGNLEALARDMDAASSPPGPTQPQIDSFKSRYVSLQARHDELARTAGSLKAQMEARFKAGGCYALPGG